MSRFEPPAGIRMPVDKCMSTDLLMMMHGCSNELGMPASLHLPDGHFLQHFEHSIDLPGCLTLNVSLAIHVYCGAAGPAGTTPPQHIQLWGRPGTRHGQRRWTSPRCSEGCNTARASRQGIQRTAGNRPAAQQAARICVQLSRPNSNPPGYVTQQYDFGTSTGLCDTASFLNCTQSD